jgi:ketosteroid isomerase-like protein
MMQRVILTVLGALGMLVATPAMATPAQTKTIEHAAHDAYVAAINSNDLERFLSRVTDDVVFQAPGTPEIVGKKALRDWAAAYLAACQTHWDKISLSFTVTGEWAFERYTYTSADTDRNTGTVTHDTGKGITIFRRDRDGQWRVAIDGWSSDKAPTP